MRHFRIKYKKKYLYDKYRYYPQYRKNILFPFRYLEKDDIFGLDLSILDDLFNWTLNIDSDGRVFVDSLKDAITISELYNKSLKDNDERLKGSVCRYTYLDI